MIVLSMIYYQIACTVMDNLTSMHIHTRGAKGQSNCFLFTAQRVTTRAIKDNLLPLHALETEWYGRAGKYRDMQLALSLKRHSAALTLQVFNCGSHIKVLFNTSPTAQYTFSLSLSLSVCSDKLRGYRVCIHTSTHRPCGTTQQQQQAANDQMPCQHSGSHNPVRQGYSTFVLKHIYSGAMYESRGRL